MVRWVEYLPSSSISSQVVKHSLCTREERAKDHSLCFDSKKKNIMFRILCKCFWNSKFKNEDFSKFVDEGVRKQRIDCGRRNLQPMSYKEYKPSLQTRLLVEEKNMIFTVTKLWSGMNWGHCHCYCHCYPHCHHHLHHKMGPNVCFWSVSCVNNPKSTNWRLNNYVRIMAQSKGELGIV